IQSSTQRAFGGLNHRSSAADGEIYDMENITSDEYPLVTPRAPRYVIEKIDKPNGIFALDGLVIIAGTTVYYKDKEVKGKTIKTFETTKITENNTSKFHVTQNETTVTVKNSLKTFSALGSKVVILPDKVYFDTAVESPELINIESTVTVEAKFQSETTTSSEANTIYNSRVWWKNFFKVGDAVTISGATKHPENNTTLIIREINDHSLKFYDNSFKLNQGTDGKLLAYTEDEVVTISRTMPDLDFICENDNRLWGCKGDTVYASKLGDLTNWNVFDGIASDSYAVDVGTPGDFTGCFTYLGYPCFFKDDVIYKVYGDKPSNFQLIRSASLGVSEGNEKSLSVAGEILFYMSRTGIVAYSGSTPQDVFLPFGDEKYNNCVAGSDGKKYYVSMQKRNGEHILAVFDTSFNTWHIEDDVNAVGFAWYNGLYILSDDGTLRLVGNAPEVPDGAEKEKSVSSSVTFAPFTYGTSRKKGVSKIGISCELEKNAEIKVEIEYDSSGDWQTVSTLDTPERRSFYLPVIPHRCDHYRLKLSGKGKWRLFSLTKEYYYGSMN
ncbi:MAG: hypothetical protein IIX94_04210, partial [Clostridia bacterium]|nr:hypothetical protein [Clostridia bacterium]